MNQNLLKQNPGLAVEGPKTQVEDEEEQVFVPFGGKGHSWI